MAHCFAVPSGAGASAPVPGDFRLVYGQYGSGNSAATNCPTVDHKIIPQAIYVPPGYLTARNSIDDWAIIRVPDSESQPSWFRAIAAFSDVQINNDFSTRYVSGYPLDPRRRRPATCRSAKFIETNSDWAVGQSGGPAYGAMPGVSQFVAFGIISYSNLTTTKSVARRLTSAIVTKLCQEIRAYPSTSYPVHECGP